MSYTCSDGDYTWRVSTLWKLVEGQEPKKVKLKSLPKFDARVWANSIRHVSTAWILDHARRINEADLSYPIILSPLGEVMDGCHRIEKARRDGLEEIDAVTLPDNYREYAFGAR